MPPRIPHKIIDGVEHKWCKECKIFKTLSSFYKAGKWHEGKCKKCKNEKAKQSYPNIKERKNMIQRIKYQQNKDDLEFIKQQREKSRKSYRRLREDSNWVMKHTNIIFLQRKTIRRYKDLKRLQYSEGSNIGKLILFKDII
tara:strand:+ start:46 stop:468 length:423 start_codon:yes stop_codon:yes gene_type:complete